jgi:hypothetical protein
VNRVGRPPIEQINVQPLLCRPLDYADHWLRTSSGGGDRCDGVGIIRLVPQRIVSLLPIEARSPRHTGPRLVLGQRRNTAYPQAIMLILATITGYAIGIADG